MAVWDYTQANLTIDGAWHTLDLSAIVPAGVTLVRLRFVLLDTNGLSSIYLKNADYTNDINIVQIGSQVVNIWHRDVAFVACSNERKIKYKVLTGAEQVALAVIGWVID